MILHSDMSGDQLLQALAYYFNEHEKIAAENEALRARLVDLAQPFKKLSDDDVLWIAQSHGIDVSTCNPLAFYTDLLSNTPVQPKETK